MAKAPAKKKESTAKPKLDIFTALNHANQKHFNWLEQQPTELASTFSPLVAMRWQSSVGGYSDVDEYILNVNYFVNIGFWELTNHPDLLWRLMCAVGDGRPKKHQWIPMTSKKKSSGKIDSLILSMYPSLNDDELSLMKSKLDLDSLKQLLRDLGLPDSDIKPYTEEFKKLNV